MTCCSGLNYTTGKWYSGIVANKEYIFCEFCREKYKYDNINMRHVPNVHNFKAKCDSYIMTEGNIIGNHIIYLYNETKDQVIERNKDTGEYPLICNKSYYVYIINYGLTLQYYSVNLDKNDVPTIFYTDSIFLLDTKLFVNHNNNLVNNNIFIEITNYVPTVDTNLFASNIDLGEFKYDRQFNKISLTSSNIKHRIKYNIFSEEDWSPEHIFIADNKCCGNLILCTNETPAELAVSNKEYRYSETMKYKHIMKIAEYAIKEREIELKELYSAINNLCH